ncbi:hypothetical protein [Lacipirellula sp.]|uniref:hypothetical protein n=1 Tax=Lacipirellula sp. TaxID=2691419 RepID=UPI003D0FD924
MLRDFPDVDYTPVRITGLMLEQQQLYAVLAVGAGSKLLPCEAADLIDVESFEGRAHEYFGVAYHLADEFVPAISSVMSQAVAA